MHFKSFVEVILTKPLLLTQNQRFRLSHKSGQRNHSHILRSEKMKSASNVNNSPHKPRKRVRFLQTGLGEVMTESFPAQYPVDKSLYLNKDEFIDIRMSAKDVVDSIVEKGDHVWSQARRASYVKTFSRAYQCCVKGREPSHGMKKELIFWTTIGHSRRGLEKFTLSDVQDRRLMRRREHLQSILFVQQQCWNEDMDFDQMSRLLRVTSIHTSKPAQKLAQLLAVADEGAVWTDSNVLDSPIPSPKKIKMKQPQTKIVLMDIESIKCFQGPAAA